ncbi:MAG: type II protein secretion system D protein [Epsilonproteobacteria bacterium]|nr:type II protein secretion system D protein [Campylobacterota bacterium]
MRFLIIFIAAFLFANKCDKRLFNLHLTEPVALKDIINSLSNECDLSVIFKDDKSKMYVYQNYLDFINISNASFREFLNTILETTPLFYTLNNKKLILSYYKTKTYKIDFIPSIRSGNTEIQTNSNKVTTEYSYDFWEELKNNLINIWDNSRYNFEDNKKIKEYIQAAVVSSINKDNNKSVNVNINPDELNIYPISVDKNSGLITVIGNKTQLRNITNYINTLKKRITKEVLIDVKIYSVELSKSHKTGIDWSQLDIKMNASNVPLRANYITGSASVFNSAVFNMEAFLNFLSKNGNVNSISNPKIVSLNNQKALVSIGDVLYYKEYDVPRYLQGSGVTRPDYTLKPLTDGNTWIDGIPIENINPRYIGKFVGILLDITPQISDEGIITLTINPRISSLKNPTDFYYNKDKIRTLPPDIKESKLMSVVRLRNNQTLVLGGLISDERGFQVNGVPVLKEIPLIKYLFSSKEEVTNRKELVFVITPKIIDLNKQTDLKDYGYGKIPSLEDLNVK